MPATNRRSDEELSDEQRLVQLLDRFRAEADKTRRSEIEREIVELVDHYFRMSLRPVMAKLFGPQMLRSGEGDSRGFTVMLNDFFVKVLESRLDAVWQAATARDLRNWASTVMANQFRDHLKGKKRRQEILQDDIGPLYDLRKRHFERRFHDGFDTLIEKLDELPDLERRLTQLHYLDGMSWEETAEELGLSKSAFYRLREQTVTRLRELLGTT